MKNESCGKWRLLIPVIVLLVVAVLALAVRCLWNGILVDATGARALSYWQALGLLVLAKILFGRFPCGGPGWRKRKMMRHWQSLSPEQREQMREEMRRRFGDWPRPPWCGGEAGPDEPA
ncbi:MAG TPA: hypothetical protein VHC86_14320 [Opitutaceae bacterium]|nr:hypothetical protein [Opitutaceae bacterium]